MRVFNLRIGVSVDVRLVGVLSVAIRCDMFDRAPHY